MATYKQSILNDKQTAVRLFESPSTLDKTLPKYKIISNAKQDNADDKNINSFPFNSRKIESVSYDSLKEWFEGNTDNVTDFNITLSDKMRNNIELTVMGDTNNTLGGRWSSDSGGKKGFIYTIIDYFKNRKREHKEKKIVEKFDVIKFFADVKLASVEAEDKYKNRLNEYISCIGYTEKTGQLALKEKLFQNLVINKYESILYANGYNRLITEEQLVKFAKNCPKALSLDYISNYTRTIPLDVIKKKIDADNMEVFDNYVILHYDPSGNAIELTPEQKKKEVEKAKDPILFGVISGSRKLYYICDWIDEMCDLTWDTVVDTLGNEILEKEFLTNKIK